MPVDDKPSFFQELRRRNVIRVALAYLLVAWVLLQIADVLFPALGLPEWTIRLVAGLLILGFPLAVFFAWAFELTPEGLKRDKDVERSDAAANAAARRLDIATIVVAVFAVGLFALDRFVWQASSEPESPLPTASAPSADSKSIAVLPFVNMSADEEQEYFSDGLTEELLNVLARGKELRVIGRTSSFQFKGKNEDLREIGRKLNVSHILEGSVRRSEDKVRITAQLIDSGDGSHLWSSTFDRTLDDIFAVQDEIANAVVSALQVELLGDAQIHGSRRNAEAYDWYLKGLSAQRLPGPENMQKAKEHFERSLELDPEFAESWQQLAAEYAAMTVAGMLPTSEGVELAKNAVNRALELNPSSAGAHYVLGSIRANFDRHWDGAKESYARALEIDPNNANALSGASMLAMALGNDTAALDYNARSIAVDPLSLRARHNKAFILYVGHDFRSAETAMLDAIEFAGGNYTYAYTVLSLILVGQERFDEALAASEKELAEPWRLAAQAIVHYALGRENDSEVALQQLIDKYSDRIAMPIGGCYAFRGDADTAMEWFNRAYAQNDPQLMLTRVHPVHDKLQGDLRFREFLRKLNLL
ncbi:MAG: hypothetical protein KJO31_04515 [Gammaproteobacteria bacterium]|nr:hypothetical protein [Gammaproteobacteria bacterium]